MYGWHTAYDLVELEYKGTHNSEHLSIANATKAIVARIIVTKKGNSPLLKFLSHNVVSNGFQYWVWVLYTR